MHMSSGYAALVAAVYLGRTNKQVLAEEGLFSEIREPANVPIVMLGTALLWMGWFGVSDETALTVAGWQSSTLLPHEVSC